MQGSFHRSGPSLCALPHLTCTPHTSRPTPAASSPERYTWDSHWAARTRCCCPASVHSCTCVRSVGLDECVVMGSHHLVSCRALSLPHSPHALSRPPSSSRISGVDSYRNLPFQIALALLVTCILGSSMSFHGFDSSFLFSEGQHFFFFTQSLSRKQSTVL